MSKQAVFIVFRGDGYGHNSHEAAFSSEKAARTWIANQKYPECYWDECFVVDEFDGPSVLDKPTSTTTLQIED